LAQRFCDVNGGGGLGTGVDWGWGKDVHVVSKYLTTRFLLLTKPCANERINGNTEAIEKRSQHLALKIKYETLKNHAFPWRGGETCFFKKQHLIPLGKLT
jgi:hypothetical protein